MTAPDIVYLAAGKRSSCSVVYLGLRVRQKHVLIVRNVANSFLKATAESRLFSPTGHFKYLSIQNVSFPLFFPQKKETMVNLLVFFTSHHFHLVCFLVFLALIKKGAPSLFISKELQQKDLHLAHTNLSVAPRRSRGG